MLNHTPDDPLGHKLEQPPDIESSLLRSLALGVLVTTVIYLVVLMWTAG